MKTRAWVGVALVKIATVYLVASLLLGLAMAVRKDFALVCALPPRPARLDGHGRDRPRVPRPVLVIAGLLLFAWNVLRHGEAEAAGTSPAGLATPGRTA